MFLENKYTNTYFRIILKAIRSNRKKTDGVYYESHHIYPKSICPERKNDKSNKVLLTAKEHYICHLLLIKMTNGCAKRSMCNAFKYMKASSKLHERYNSRLFSFFREKYYEQSKGRPVSNISRQKSSQSQLGEKSYWYGRKRSEENKDKIRQSKLGKPRSSDTKQKLSDKMAKRWKIIHPNGIEENITNLASFCRENKLHDGHLSVGKTKGYQAFRLD